MAPRRLVIREQLEAMIDFIDQNKSLSDGIGSNISYPDVQEARQKWASLAKKLNAIPGGAKKNPIYWRRYWVEWRYRVRRKAFNVKHFGPHYKVLVPLDDLDIRVLEYCNKPLAPDRRVSHKLAQKLKLEDSDSEQMVANTAFESSDNVFDRQEEQSSENKTKVFVSEDSEANNPPPNDASSHPPNDAGSPPPQWALDLENRRIGIEERIANAVESIAVTMRKQEQRRAITENRILNTLTALTETLQVLKGGVQEAVQSMQRFHPTLSNENGHPVENVFLME